MPRQIGDFITFEELAPVKAPIEDFAAFAQEAKAASPGVQWGLGIY
jgi:hypothetical protein